MGATDKGRAAAIAILQRTDTFKDLQYSRNCLSDMLLFLSALGVPVQYSIPGPNSRRNVSVDVVLRSFVAPQLANCRYTKSPDSFVKIPKKVVRCRL